MNHGDESEEHGFRNCKIFPDNKEIQTNTSLSSSLTANAPCYKGIEQYLNLQFRLLREDCFLPIKSAIQARRNHRKFDSSDIRFYQKVTIVNYEALNSFFCVRVKVHKNRRNYASIVAFSQDNFKNVLIGKEYNQTLEKDLEDDEMIVEFDKHVDIGLIQDSAMIEYFTYFEPHFNVLQALQKRRRSNFPMAKYIISLDFSSRPPKYLEKTNCQYNIYDHRISPFENWDKLKKLSQMDAFQFKAFKSAITQELAVIQGPPGTGKTYVGVKIVQTLLSNLTLWYEHSPILIICFSNHAVDRFLEDVLEFTQNIIKVGGPITKESLQDFAITGIRHLKKDQLWEKLNKLTEIKTEVKHVSNVLKEMEVGNSIIDFGAMNEMQMELKQFVRIDVVDWLLEKTVPDFKTDKMEHCLKDRCFKFITIESLLKNTQTLTQNKAQLEGRHTYLLEKLQFAREHPTKTKPVFCNPTDMNPDERWNLYSYWLHLCTSKLKEKLNLLYQKYHKVYKRQFEEIRVQAMVESLKRAHVIGMTTTMAARYNRELEILKCPIIIVEEAAKLLESHVVTNVSKECQHLILIGDHQQLQPKAMSTAFKRNHNLATSLFERIVNNSSGYCFLNQHHRLRPEIANLLTPLYPSFKKYPSTIVRPPVKGMDSCLFFTDISETDTKFNVFSFVVYLAKFLKYNGHEAEDITVLCAHPNTIPQFKNEFNEHEDLRNVRIAFLDYFQGEESEIVLLYLDAKVGFGKGNFWNNNKISVALSRAKNGLYIFGNMNQLSDKHELWIEMKTIFESNQVIGEKLPLKCPEHKTVCAVGSVDDFKTLFNDGCGQVCDAKLKCGHSCPYNCYHILKGLTHDDYRCEEECLRLCKSKTHKCKNKCYEICASCEEVVEKVFPCTHKAKVRCSDILQYKCKVLTTVKFSCGHFGKKYCHEDVATLKCSEPCSTILKCGHSCGMFCHLNTDPSHAKYICKKRCLKFMDSCSTQSHKCKKLCFEKCELCTVTVVKTKVLCGHTVEVPCHVNVPNLQCTEPCLKILPCGHQCRKKCSNKCTTNCDFEVPKKIPKCGHTLKVKCFEEPNPALCTKKCPLLLPCGHPCTSKCNEPCTTLCTNLVQGSIPTECGHLVTKIQCHIFNNFFKQNGILPSKYCTHLCDTKLECGHICFGNCNQCFQGRFHKRCEEKCTVSLICGHSLKVPCKEVLQPCTLKCLNRCPHNSCSKKCNEICTPCTKKCTRSCIHQQCTLECSEVCTVPPCGKACDKQLNCGHPCMGFCGEPCPSKCSICDESLPRDEKYVVLYDCKHDVSNSEMEKTFQKKMDWFAECPQCGVVIINTFRYSDHIKKILTKVKNIKVEVYGHVEESNQQIQYLRELFFKLKGQQVSSEFCKIKESVQCLEKVFVKAIKNKQKFIFRCYLETLTTKLKLLEYILICCQTTDAHNLLMSQVTFLYNILKKDHHYFTKQEIGDLDLEMRRFLRVLQLVEIKQRLKATLEENFRKLEEDVLMVIGYNSFSLEKSAAVLQLLQKFSNDTSTNINLLDSYRTNLQTYTYFEAGMKLLKGSIW